MSSFWKKLFIPHEANNHKAELIKPISIGLFIAVYLLNQSFLKSFALLRPGVLGYSSEITAQKVLDLTNRERQKQGLPALSYNPTLSKSASDKAADMFASNYWAHNSPSGKTPWDFFRLEGYQYSVAGENLAKDFYDTDTMMRAWMKSPTHKANIVSPKYQEIGIGVVNGVLNGVKTTLVVQHFGTPQNGKVFAKTSKVTPVPNNQVLSVEDSVLPNSEFMVSPLQISKLFGGLMFVIIIGVLFIDGYTTLKAKTHRLSGSTVGHIGFLGVILVLLLIVQQGTIF